ncbi:Uncharacterized membrane protein YcaP, DUF421 family [Modestobacter sp. DSM 44400]|uniref:DUF421 domain-containing protein n=1 Tax=Modestobacter sp. DSM 44400 TaxID=1550230 RepID=UPI00089BDC43|nr:YetF domain-containing protein [Modestobacter sp. DSM 44400]SDY87878.1 Uncharacterized membrane protein YcaP, DUF421 family [Modestobacter sp. DSM 44400]
MDYIIGDPAQLVWVAGKALLLYVTAVVGFRLGERRTLAEMSPFDFVAAVAVGAVVGRVPNASDTSYVAGALTLVTVLFAHSVLTRARRFDRVAALVDHVPRLLVTHGHVLSRELRRSGLTYSDLDGLLRRHNIRDLSEVRYVIFEQRGNISVVREPGYTYDGDGDVLQRVLTHTEPGPAGGVAGTSGP